MKLRQPLERIAGLTGRKHQHDPLRQQTASHKRQGPRGGAIKPLCVVDQTYERPVLRRLGQQPEDGQSDQERVRRRRRPESKRDAKRFLLGLREAVHQFEERRAQLLSCRKWKLHLGLDPERPGDPKLMPDLDHVLEQRGLANTRFAMHHQHTTAPAERAIQEPVEHLALTIPSKQPPR